MSIVICIISMSPFCNTRLQKIGKGLLHFFQYLVQHKPTFRLHAYDDPKEELEPIITSWLRSIISSSSSWWWWWWWNTWNYHGTWRSRLIIFIVVVWLWHPNNIKWISNFFRDSCVVVEIIPRRVPMKNVRNVQDPEVAKKGSVDRFSGHSDFKKTQLSE